METTCKKCGSKNVIWVEYEPGHPERWDGVSEIDCRDCGARFGRFSGRELAEGEAEKASARFA
jgi:DNA-directed RNA polymerase subunit RPC12/RpoP